jgi:predicted ATPase
MVDRPQSDLRTGGLDPVLLSTPFGVQTNWHVITGAQSCGKTTLVDGLAAAGFQTLPESARPYFEREMAKGRTLEEILRNPAAVQIGITELQLAAERRLRADEVLFLDRGLPDCVTICRFWGLDPNDLLPHCFWHRYASVFVLDRLPIQRDGLRIENEALAACQDEWLPRDYAALGYRVVRVPVLPPEERLAFVLQSLAEQGLM